MATIASARMQLARSRRRIDQLDRAIVRLLNERAREAALAGSFKRDLKLPVYCREREATVFGNIKQANSGPLTEEALTRIYRQIVRSMRGVQNRFPTE
jgi:chorismate mutase